MLAIDPNRWPLIVTTPISVQIFLMGLDCLIFGRPQRTLFSLTTNLVRGRFRATHDSRGRAPEPYSATEAIQQLHDRLELVFDDDEAVGGGGLCDSSFAEHGCRYFSSTV